MYSYGVHLIRVVDGDTVILDIDLGFSIWRKGASYRLGRINAPELRDDPAGVIAKAQLSTFLAGKTLLAETKKTDKYGRFLVELFADGVNASDWMVAQGQAIYLVYV